MVFYLIGLGLGDARDISVRGLEIVKKCHEVYLESYTSILSGLGASAAATLAEFYGRPVLEADRLHVEQGLEQLLVTARDTDVALLVVGDPLSATTHQQLVLQARALGVTCRVLANVSVMTAVAGCGLQLYRFGETVSLPFWTATWRPLSCVDKIVANMARGLHTLCLLDIRVHELTEQCLARGRGQEYEPARFMTASQAAAQLLEAIDRRAASGDGGADGGGGGTEGDDPAGSGAVGDGGDGGGVGSAGGGDGGSAAAGSGGDGEACYLTSQSRAVALARLGSVTERIVYGTLQQLAKVDMGQPLHCLIIVGHTHPVEDQFLQLYTLSSEQQQSDFPPAQVT